MKNLVKNRGAYYTWARIIHGEIRYPSDTGLWLKPSINKTFHLSNMELNFNKILSYFFYNMIEWNTSSRRQRTCSMGFVKHSGRGPPSRQIQFSISILVTSSKPRGTVACMEKYLQWFTNAS